MVVLFTPTSTSWSNIAFSNSPIYRFGPQYIKKLVEEMSDGQFKINIDGEDLIMKRQKAPKIKPYDVLSAVNNRLVECGHTASYYYSKEDEEDQHPSLIFGTTVPFGLNAQQQIAWLNYRSERQSSQEKDARNSELLTFMQQHYRDLGLNIIQFPAGGTGGQMGGWFKNKIPEDIQNYEELNSPNGRKQFIMRIAGLGGRIAGLNGVITNSENKKIRSENLIGREITNALNDNLIDAAEWIGPFGDQNIGLNKAGAKYYYYPGWWEPGTTYEMQVNLDAWEELPGDLQKIFKAACYQAHLKMIAEYDNQNRRVLWGWCGDGSGIELHPFDQTLLENTKNKRNTILDKIMKEGIYYRVYQEYLQFEQNIQSWHSLISLEQTGNTVDWCQQQLQRNRSRSQK